MRDRRALDLQPHRITTSIGSANGVVFAGRQRLAHHRYAVQRQHVLGLALGQCVGPGGKDAGARVGSHASKRRARRLRQLARTQPLLVRVPRGQRRKAVRHRAEQRQPRQRLGFGGLRPFHPVRHPQAAGHLAVLDREVIEDLEAAAIALPRHHQRHHGGAIGGVREDRVAALDKRIEVVGGLCRQVARIARGAEVRDVRFEHLARGVARLRQRHAEALGLVGSHDARAARARYDGHAGLRRTRRLGEEHRRRHQLLDGIDQHHARLAQRRAVGAVGTRHRAGVRHGRRGTRRAACHLVDDERLAGLRAQLRRAQDAAGVGQALEHAGDRGARRVSREVGNLVGHVDIARIAAREHMAEGRAVVGGLLQREGQRTRLTDQPDGVRRQHARARGQRRERHQRVADVVGEADGVRPEQLHAAAPGDAGQLRLVGNLVRIAGLGIA
ncbi:hypothetical protein D3C81_1032540 [compost metagenome]